MSTSEIHTCGGYVEKIQPKPFTPKHEVRHILKAMQATDIPAGTSELWEVAKMKVPSWMMLNRNDEPGIATHLFCHTLETLNEEHGELVMVDHVIECQTHLEFVLHAKGRILVSGLGLGCVVRGILARGRASKITVIERDRHVLRLVAPHISPDVEIIHADVRDWVKHSDDTFDYAWHDLWSDDLNDDPNLPVMHAEVLYGLRKRIRHQGAWKYPRMFRRLLEREKLGLKKP